MTYTQETMLRALSLGETDFSHVSFPPYTNLSDLRSRGVSLAGCQLQHGGFWRVNLAGLAFDESDCTHAKFMLADVHFTSFRAALLSYTNFEMANCTETNWHSADLQWANLKSACCKQANFTHANLTFCDLSDADCTEADFTGANFAKANIARVTFRRAKITRKQLEATGGLRFIQTDLWTKCTLAPETGENLYQLLSSGGLNGDWFDQHNGFRRVDDHMVRRGEDGWKNWPWLKSPFRFFLLGADCQSRSWRKHPISSLIIEWLEEWRQAPH
jgi:uncharacterized protein YjbI with pentapeptide repeats